MSRRRPSTLSTPPPPSTSPPCAIRSSSPMAPTRRPPCTFSAWLRRPSALCSTEPSSPVDYVEAAETLPWVLSAGTAFRWTGSWLTVFTTADPRGNAPVTEPNQISLVELLNRRKLAGYESYAPATYAGRARPYHHRLRRHGLARERCRGRSSRAPRQRRTPQRQRGIFLRRRLHLRHAALPKRPRRRHPVRSRRQRRARHRVSTPRRQRCLSIPARHTSPSAASEILRIENDPSYPERGTIRVIAEGGR